MNFRFIPYFCCNKLTYDRPRPVSLQTTYFSSEAGVVLTFFAYFFVLRQKSKWGFRGKAPVISKFRVLGNLTDNHLK